jgi:hypothetical protein
MTLTETITQIKDTVSTWQGISAVPHRFGGIEFQLNNVEVGHIHRNGMIDIPFNTKLRKVLVEHHYTEVHHLLPDSGWTSFYLGRTGDLQQAIELFRLSYIQKGKRRAKLDVNAELDQLHFNQAVHDVLITPAHADEED